MIQLGPRRTKADIPWSIKPARVWPGYRSEPQIVASLRREHAEQSVSPFDVGALAVNCCRWPFKSGRLNCKVGGCAGRFIHSLLIDPPVRAPNPNFGSG